MAIKSELTNRTTSHRSATIQWVAIGIIAVLGVLAAFVLLGEDGATGGGHSGLQAPESAIVIS